MNKWLIVAFCSMVLVACKKKVEVVKPITQSITESVYASGSIKAQNQYQVFAMANGTIQDVLVAEGDQVHLHSPLFVLTNQTSKLSTENAKLNAELNDFSANQNKLKELSVNINAAKLKYQNDSSLYSKQLMLYAQKVGSEQDLEQRLLGLENSRALYQSAQLKYADLKRQLNLASKQANTSLAISQRMLGDYTVKSDVEGTVYAVYKEHGEMVNTQTPLAVVGSSTNFKLELQVDEYDIVRIKKGQLIFVTLDSYKGQVFKALVDKINPFMNERTKSFVIEALFIKAPNVLYPNLTVEANIVIQTKNNVLTVPRNFLSSDGFVTKADGTKVKVEVGLKDYERAEIISGITINDELIIPVK
jgi:HlyD family secretion protein